jgi:hypothetical protein
LRYRAKTNSSNQIFPVTFSFANRTTKKYKMKKLPVLLSLLLCAPVLFAQNTTIHDANAQVRNVGSFHAIEVSNGIRLILKQGNTDAVAVSASSTDLISKIKTEVSNGKLKIYFDHSGWKNWSLKGKELKAYVTIRNIDELEANSGANATTDGNISTTDMKISLSSGADFDGQVTASKLWIDQSSGSDMDIKGKVGYVEIKTSSGSDFNGYDLVSETCKADASSGSDIEITVNKELQAEASSGGDVNYKGNASITNISNSSGGRIKKQS